MRISRKIGLSFFLTFFLVILLGAVSIYSLRHIYRGLNQVLAKDLPASRAIYQVGISMDRALSELNNFLITGNDNFRTGYEHSYIETQDNIAALKRFIVKEEERKLFGGIVDTSGEINKISGDVFENKKEIMGLFKDARSIETRYTQILDELLDFEENKMLAERDILLIHAQYIPASQLIVEASSRFSNLLNGLTNYVIRGADEDPSSFMQELLLLDKSIRDYKNYHGYSLSDKERSLAAELVELSGEIKPIVNSIVDAKETIDTSINELLAKEKEFMEALDEIIALKKSGISSKLGMGAALTEDIPAIHNISALEKDIIESWRISGSYILTNNEDYQNLYYQLRQNIERVLKDYERHARLRGTERYVEDITQYDRDILKVINSSLAVFDAKEAHLASLASIKKDLEGKIDELLQYNDSRVKEAKDPQKVLEKDLPARWLLARLKDKLSDSYRLVINYLNEKEAQYKDLYSEAYFDMKKYVNRYRTFSSETGLASIEEIEAGLDRFNSSILGVLENHDKIVESRGWTLIKLEEALMERLNKAVEVEISQIEKNKVALRNRIAMINTFIFLIIAGVAIIAIFIIFYTTKSITNPIQELYDGAGVIGRGNLDHRLDIKTGDEIQDLADGFNRMAGELKGLYTNLENKVKERTAQLAKANKELDIKNKELDDFTYIVSHDLKEPLRGIRAFTRLLAEEYSSKLDKEGKEHLKTISDSGARMTRLIEDLLNLSRIGRIKNIEPDVDLNDLLSEVRKNLAYSLEEKGADLKIKEDFPKVTCDRIRISEVFSNLISNAVKYSKKGVKPVVEIGYFDKEEVYEFYVKDNGIGIEKEYYDKVFQIFQRLQAKDDYEGTGAGLTIVKKIVENHGGKNWVESKVGVGSIFYFTLPKTSAEG